MNKAHTILTALLLASLLPAAGTAALSASEPAGESEPLLDQLGQTEAPFVDGEELTYSIYWKPPALLKWLVGDVKAGEVRVRVEKDELDQRPVWKLTAKAVTTGFVRKRILEVDDHFESVIDRDDYRSYRLSKTIREGDKTRKDVVSRFQYAEDQVHVRKTDLKHDPPKTEVKTFEGIPGPLADVVSVFYVARLRSLSPGDRYRIHLADESEPHEVQVKVLEREETETPLDEYDSVRISTVGAFFNEGGGFLIWYSTDDRRLPLRFQADAKIGKVYGELTGIARGNIIKKTIRLGNSE
ncbi:MAG TPA: DUF3108 domain-containing protein [Acidobacteriota bacterium]|nr:DUF3108 domain-containing protein [Acidobacteriota bacterium]